LPEIRVLRGPKLPRIQHMLNGSAMPLERKVILLTHAPIRALVFFSHLDLYMPLTMVPTLFLLLPIRTMLEGELIMSLWRKPRKL
jgi:hypothetical protein